MAAIVSEDRLIVVRTVDLHRLILLSIDAIDFIGVVKLCYKGICDLNLLPIDFDTFIAIILLGNLIFEYH